MASSPGSSPIAPLSPGNVVSAAFQLYRENAKQYLQIALVSVGWSLLPILGLIAIATVAAIVIGATQQPAAGIGLFVLASIAVLVFAFFCFARSLANAALISRLAYGELSNQQTDVAAARRFVKSRAWQFLWVQVRVSLIVLGVILAFYLLGAILLGILIALTAGGITGAGGGNPLVAFVLAVLLVVLVAVTVVLVLRVSARLFGAEVPLAVEQQSSAGESISRFWQLAEGNVGRIVLITLVAFAVTLPILILSNVVSSVPQAMIEASAQSGTEQYAVLIFLSSIISLAVSLLLNVIVLPIWQTLKAVLYYDLRNRREGLDLQFRDRSL